MFIRGILSDVLSIVFGVQQGSVLGTLVIIMYAHHLGITAQRHGVQFHL